MAALKAAPEQALAAAGARLPAHRPRPDKRALPMPRMTDSEVEE